jgi:hypothetical protein
MKRNKLNLSGTQRNDWRSQFDIMIQAPHALENSIEITFRCFYFASPTLS